MKTCLSNRSSSSIISIDPQKEDFLNWMVSQILGLSWYLVLPKVILIWYRLCAFLSWYLFASFKFKWYFSSYTLQIESNQNKISHISTKKYDKQMKSMWIYIYCFLFFCHDNLLGKMLKRQIFSNTIKLEDSGRSFIYYYEDDQKMTSRKAYMFEYKETFQDNFRWIIFNHFWIE